MKTKELAKICGVDPRTIQINAKKVGIVLENGKSHDFTEDEVKKVQAQLMKNFNNQGNGSEIVKQSSNSAFEAGISLQVIMQSGNIEAAKEICQMITEGTKAQHYLMLEQERNQKLQLENKQLEEENDYLKKANEFNTAQLGYYRNKYHSFIPI